MRCPNSTASDTPLNEGTVPAAVPADTLRRWIADFEVGVARMTTKQRALAETSLSQMRDVLAATSAPPAAVPADLPLAAVRKHLRSVTQALKDGDTMAASLALVEVEKWCDASSVALATSAPPPVEAPAIDVRIGELRAADGLTYVVNLHRAGGTDLTRAMCVLETQIKANAEAEAEEWREWLAATHPKEPTNA